MLTLEEARKRRAQLVTDELALEALAETAGTVDGAARYYDARDELREREAELYADALRAVAEGHALGRQLAQIALGREVCTQQVEHTAATSGVVR